MAPKAPLEEYVIEPNPHPFRFDLKHFWNYRDLLFLLVRRDFLTKYKQTVLGPAWFILQPLLTTVVFTVIFGHVARISTDKIPPLLFYLCGLVAWGYFAQSLTAVSTALIGNAYLFSKVYFPRLIVPLAVIISNCFSFAIQIITFLSFYFYFKFFTPLGGQIQPNISLLLLPLYFFQSAALALGVGLWIASLTVKYRDLQHLVGFMVQLWMYATPIIYPMSSISGKWRILTFLNPMSPVLELYRFAFFGTGQVRGDACLVSLLLTFFSLLSGIFLFNKTERNFVDTL